MFHDHAAAPEPADIVRDLTSRYSAIPYTCTSGNPIPASRPAASSSRVISPDSAVHERVRRVQIPWSSPSQHVEAVPNGVASNGEASVDALS